MKFSATLAAFMASAVMASPLATRQTTNAPFVLELGFTSNPNLKGPLYANNHSFWVGKPSSSFCDSAAVGCVPANLTSFTTDGSHLNLNTQVPGGQQVYIDPQGLLSYTSAHSAYIPDNSLTTGLTYLTNKAFNPFLEPYLCSQDADYQTWNLWFTVTNSTTGQRLNLGSAGTNACYQVNINVVPYDGAATWAYD